MLARFSTFIVLGYAVIVILFVLAIAVSESFAAAIGEFFKTDAGLSLSAVFCVFLGMSFILAAHNAKFPLFFRIIGAISLIESPFLLLLPASLWAAYIDFWLIDNFSIYRIFAVPAGVGFSVFLIVAALPGIKTTNSYLGDNET